MTAALAVLLGAFMIANGLSKVLQLDVVAERMAEIHVEGGWLTAQGVLEMLLGAATVIPRTRTLGLIGLLGVLIGAVGAHLGAGQNLSAAVPAMVSLLWAATVFALANRSVLARPATAEPRRDQEPTADCLRPRGQLMEAVIRG